MEHDLEARRLCEELVALRAARRQLDVREFDIVWGLIAAYRSVPAPLAPGAEQLLPAGAEGTPPVAEFLHLELAALLGVSEPAAWALVRDVANLASRHPRLWDAVHAGGVEGWQARQLAAQAAAAGLSLAACHLVDARLAPAVGRLPWSRLKRKLTGLIVVADTALAAHRASAAATQRFVRIRHDGEGLSILVARLATADAVALGSAVEAIGAQLAAANPSLSPDEARSVALGDLARPSAARGASPPSAAPGTPRRSASPVLPRPRASVVVHLSAGALAGPGSVARAEGGIGPLLRSQLRELLGHHRVTVRPVIDLAGDPPADSYEIPVLIRDLVMLREPYSVFPFASRVSRSCDLDHTSAYTPTGPPGQTRPSNLGPLGRRAHRAKTHGGWQLVQPAPGVYEWQSPLGFRYRVDRCGSTALAPPPQAA